MINKIIKSILLLVFSASMVFGANATRFNVVDGDADKKYMHMIEKDIANVGFIMSDPHEHINNAYESKYGNTKHKLYDSKWKKTLDNLGFFSIANDKKLNSLLKKAPQLGGFSPFNLHIYKQINEDKTYIGHLEPDAMLDMVGIKDKSIRSEFKSMFTPLDALITKKLGGKVVISKYKRLPAEPMMNFEFEFDRGDDLDEFIDEFQENFEAAFEDKDYIIAGFKNFKEAYADLGMDFDEYDAYWVYSLCHLKFSYDIFNKGRPDAGVFAPCSMYMYIKKGTNKLVIGMPKLSNWKAVMTIDDSFKSKRIDEIDAEIISTMNNLNVQKEKEKTTKLNVSTLKTGEIPTYFIGEYIDVKKAIVKLKSAGFEILTIHDSVEKGKTIVFTNSALKIEGAKPGRAHIAVMRLFVDEQEKMISFTNPIYFGKAYMQKQYNHKIFQAVADDILNEFQDLRPSVDKMKFNDLADYHFMIGMPYYDDVDELAQASNKALLKASKDYKNGASLLFELKLSKFSTLLGYDLSRRTKKFVKKIGRANTAILPYCISIENGKATSLEAKYYIALSYPLLTMTKFMTIASVPGAITKDLEKPFKKMK